MHVQILLESPFTVWTNLDHIKGKVVLKLFSTTSLSSIVVKLEGESRTRLVAPSAQDPNDRPKPREEIHKILYRLATVFPPTHLEKVQAPPRHYTLNAGTYEYPFAFKIPFNNSCHSATTAANISLPALPSLPGFRLDAKPPTNHVKTTLPPTLTAFPGMAEIRYFIKVTVNRKEFYKENVRVHQFFNFLPIEPPRNHNSGSESFARRQHEFHQEASPATKAKKGLFSGLRKSSSGNSPAPPIGPLPKIRVDARLPSPAIITCNNDVPLRILVGRLNPSAEQLYLQSLHIQLNGLTHIRAHDIAREESSSWVLLSISNMNVPLRFPKNPIGDEGEEMLLDPVAWKNHPLPNSVAPSFETCNISRKYVLEIRVGIGHGVSSSQNQTVLPLRHEVQVYSGIEPPAALLAAMKKRRMPARKPVNPGSFGRVQSLEHTSSPNSPGGPPSPTVAGPSTQPQYAPLPEGEVEPPPSYEDAIAGDLPPVDGGRGRNYMPPPLPNGTGGFDADRKGGRRAS